MDILILHTLSKWRTANSDVIDSVYSGGKYTSPHADKKREVALELDVGVDSFYSL